MIELRITGETPQEFLQQIQVASAALLFRGAVISAGAAPAAPSVGSGENKNPTEPAPGGSPDQLPPTDAAKTVRRGRPAKTSEPAPEVGATVPGVKPVEEVLTEAISEVPTVTTVEELRALLNQMIAKVSSEATAKLISKYGTKISLIDPAKYPEMAREAHKAITDAGK